MSKQKLPTAIERAQEKVAKLDPDQRAALLALAGIGNAQLARTLGRTFKMLDQALDATDDVRVGKGGNGRLARRPNWQARINAGRTLLEWIAPAVKKSVNAQPGRTVVNVVTQDYARGMRDGLQRAEDVVIDVQHEILDEQSEVEGERS